MVYIMIINALNLIVLVSHLQMETVIIKNVYQDFIMTKILSIVLTAIAKEIVMKMGNVLILVMKMEKTVVEFVLKDFTQKK